LQNGFFLEILTAVNYIGIILLIDDSKLTLQPITVNFLTSKTIHIMANQPHWRYQPLATILANYPNEWVLLGNPMYDEGVLYGSRVIFHSSHRAVVEAVSQQKAPYFQTLYTVFVHRSHVSQVQEISRRAKPLEIPKNWD
jgi:hypothetical protein